MAAAFDALVLNAGLRQSLAAVRSLGRGGLAVAAVDTVPHVPAFWSKWCRQAYVCPAGEATDAYLAYLEQLLDSPGARVLISSHDGTIELLRRHRARVERRAAIALAPEPALSVAVDKQRTLAVARQLNVRIPRTIALEGTADVPAALREIGLPAVVKPAQSWVAHGDIGARFGAQLVTTVDETRRVVAEITRLGGITLLQTLLTGRREAVSLLYANGTMQARFAQWAKRVRPPLGGESVLRQSIEIPRDIGDAAECLVRDIGLEGYTEVEFRRDSTGEPYLMEINPRLSASVEIAVRCGVDFPRLLHQWASGDAIDRVTTYRTGRWMRHLEGDVMTTINAIEQRGRPGVAPPLQAVLGFGASCLKPMAYDYVDWRDPLPAIKALADFARDLTRGSARAAIRGTVSAAKARRFAAGSAARKPSRSAQAFDVVVVGAGPYGLSTAAHLLERGLRVAVFGRPLELWRDHMPAGMLLRSHAWASHLSDPRNEHGFDRFSREANRDIAYPVSKDAFVEYGRWFQQRAVPGVEEIYVTSIRRAPDGFAVELENGRVVTSAAVVMATGPKDDAHRPDEYGHLPPALASHSCDHGDFARFSGKRVVVVGGGQSAIEYAALLNEAGAAVHVVSRRPIAWRARDRASERTRLERIIAPDAGVAPGWKNWTLDHAPYLFYRLSQRRKDRYNGNYMSGASDWLRDRIIGHVTLHEGQTVIAADACGDTIRLALSSGTTVIADHVILATGYRVDLARLTMLDAGLQAQIRTDLGVPVLTRWFESTVPGLYFVGMTSLRAFGPLYRFVAGCSATARRVATAVARRTA